MESGVNELKHFAVRVTAVCEAYILYIYIYIYICK